MTKTDLTNQKPHHQAAFINAIAEEGTKAEAIKHLQETWNDLCETRQREAALFEENSKLKQWQELALAIGQREQERLKEQRCE